MVNETMFAEAKGVTEVEICYALPEQQYAIKLTMPAGSTAFAAIESSMLLKQFPTLNLDNLEIGIFGKRVPLNIEIKQGDRIEIYRPLIIDPKMARRLRAKKKTKNQQS